MKKTTTTFFLVLLAVVLGAVAPAAQAATSATGSQSVTGTPQAQLEATFPSSYAFSDFSIMTNNLSTEQVVNVKSNKAWGVKVSSDQTTGLMREWNGSAYVTSGKVLTSALNWANTSYDGSAVTPTYAAMSSTQALVAGSKPKTGNSGKNVGVTFRQFVDYNDDADLGSNTYRILVAYDAAQGF